MKRTPAQILLEKHLHELGLHFAKEQRFCERMWRFDYVLYRHEDAKDAELSCLRIAVEIEGGIWMRGRHTRGKGYQSDLDKYNEATMRGFRVLRFSTEDVLKGRAKAFIGQWLKN